MQLDRSQGIGCSDIPAIMGVSPWKTSFQLWEEKISGKNETRDNSAMKYGREMEPIIRKEVEKKTGVTLEAVKITHPSKPWLWASLDGYNRDENIVSEFKTASKEDHLRAISGNIPEKYWPQVQGQMEVVGVDSLIYCSYYDGDFEILKVKKDRGYCEDMIFKVEMFWEAVVLQTPPEGYRCKKGDEQWNDTTDRVKSIRGQIEALQRQEMGLMDVLKRLSKGYSVRGDSSFLQKQEVTGSIKYKEAIEEYIATLRAVYPEIDFPDVQFEQYRKKSFEKWALKFIS